MPMPAGSASKRKSAGLKCASSATSAQLVTAVTTAWRCPSTRAESDSTARLRAPRYRPGGEDRPLGSDDLTSEGSLAAPRRSGVCRVSSVRRTSAGASVDVFSGGAARVELSVSCSSMSHVVRPVRRVRNQDLATEWANLLLRGEVDHRNAEIRGWDPRRQGCQPLGRQIRRRRPCPRGAGRATSAGEASPGSARASLPDRHPQGRASSRPRPRSGPGASRSSRAGTRPN